MPSPRACAAAAVAALALVATTAGAQDVISIGDLRRGLCVHFLAEPAGAIEALGTRYRPVVAGEAPDLDPALRTLIDGEPEYATWVPGQVCVLEAGSFARGGQAASESGRAAMLGWAALRAREVGEGTPHDVPAWRALTFFSPDRTLRRQVRDALVNLEGADYEVGTAVGSTDDRIRLKAADTELVWEGRTAGEPTTAEGWGTTLLVDGRRTDRWAAVIGLTPTTAQPLVGTLQILGKGYLAQAMKGSPMRMVGPLVTGGQGTLELSQR